jgi:23S rRNA (cytosine1962-C5)-methyltransferase
MTVVVNRKAVHRVQDGHPWIYKSDVVSSNAGPGDLVRVETERGRPIGWALWSTTSQISLRMVAIDEAPEEPRFWRERLAAAIEYRRSLPTSSSAMRLVHGEADRLPALVVDRYGDYLVVQTLCQGMDRRMDTIVEALVELVQPRGILARNDPKVRRLEGLGEEIRVVFGEVPETIEVTEGAVGLIVDPHRGQKTGLFLDQRENHEAAARYARGRALDAFTYQGGFALQMAPHCESVLALDSSAPAVAATAESARRNGIDNIETQEGNAFDELRELAIADRRFDTIVLDPPAFARNKAAVERAIAGYKEINLRALKLLQPGGHLITCSCSYNVDEALFEAVITQAAADARASVVVVEKRMQARDHPVLLGVPETHYLKCFVLRKLG